MKIKRNDFEPVNNFENIEPQIHEVLTSIEYYAC